MTECTFPRCSCTLAHEAARAVERANQIAGTNIKPYAWPGCHARGKWVPEVDTADRCQGSNYNMRGWGNG